MRKMELRLAAAEKLEDQDSKLNKGLLAMLEEEERAARQQSDEESSAEEGEQHEHASHDGDHEHEE